MQSTTHISNNNDNNENKYKKDQEKLQNTLLQDLENTFSSILALRNLALKDDEHLLNFMLNESKYSDKFKQVFFKEISFSINQRGGTLGRLAGAESPSDSSPTLIFLKEKFLSFLQSRVLNHSYTFYTNKIGLGSKARVFIKQDTKLVLNFPFKDCLLKGAQMKDEKKATNEIFFNEILAKDEIDAIFYEPKVLCNFRDISKDSISSPAPLTPPARLKPYTFFTRDPEINKARGTKENTITDNLLIKGNNLIALHSLKSQFRGQVKLIYIDPPYNTGNDSFNYNDNFNHSTWLVFMKNRLEIARELLRDDGVIFIQCDDNEQAYLKVLCDEIFGRENFISCFVWEKKRVRQNDARFYNVNHEYILNYATNKIKFKPNLLERTDEMIKAYKNPDNDPRGVWVAIPLTAKSGTDSMKYKITFPNGVEYETKYGYPRYSKEKLMQLYDDNRLYFGKNGNAQPSAKKFLSEVKDGVVHNTLLIMDDVGSTQRSASEIKALFSDSDSKLFATPKPEALIKRIIEISTKENDLILDFFAGSGTTAAVAHKMKRQYIAIEQMDYIESITLKRLQKVIAGEQGGVSKALNWQGGGGFKYFELMGLNAIYKHKIENLTGVIQAGVGLESNNENIESNLKINEELNALYKELESKAFLDYRMDIKEMLKDEDFDKLDLENKKRVLYTILDANMDYIPLCDMQDKRYKIDDDVIKMNMDFYGDEI